jgi:sugar/nucleoside kinase (ribokinase family)
MSAGDARAHITLGPGGQGANVAVRLAREGARVRLIAPLADDQAGRLLREHLVSEGVDLRSVLASRSSMVVVLVEPGGARTMRSDRAPISANLTASLAGCDWVHASGYVLRDAAEAGLVVDAIRATGPGRVSVAGGSFASWADAGVARDAIDAIRAGLLVMNREEAALLAREPMRTIADAAAALATPDRLAVVTDGERGCAAAAGWIEQTIIRDALAPGRPAVDSTGAGDAFTASLVGALAASWPPSPDVLAAALELAAREGAAATIAIGAQSAAASSEGGAAG